MISTVVAILASTAGWRYVLPVTMVPMRTFFDAFARASSALHPSRQAR